MSNFMNGYNGLNGGYLQPNYNYNVNSQYNNQQPNLTQNSQFFNEFRMMTEDEIKAYVVNPGCRLFALDKEKMKFCIKSTDSLGNSAIERFVLSKEMTENNQSPTISKKEFEDINNEISYLKNELETIKSTLHKGDKENG